MGELQKRIKNLSKTYPFFEEALESWVEEMQKEFPEMDDIIRNSPKNVDKAVLWVKLANRRGVWFEKWLRKPK